MATTPRSLVTTVMSLDYYSHFTWLLQSYHLTTRAYVHLSRRVRGKVVLSGGLFIGRTTSRAEEDLMGEFAQSPDGCLRDMTEETHYFN